MKISKRQLKRIIREEKARLSELGIDRQSGQELYADLTDAQQLALINLRRAVDECVAVGVSEADMIDTFKSR